MAAVIVDAATILAVVSEHGGRPGARLLGLSWGTVEGIIQGRTKAPSAKTIAKADAAISAMSARDQNYLGQIRDYLYTSQNGNPESMRLMRKSLQKMTKKERSQDVRRYLTKRTQAGKRQEEDRKQKYPSEYRQDEIALGDLDEDYAVSESELEGEAYEAPKPKRRRGSKKAQQEAAPPPDVYEDHGYF